MSARHDPGPWTFDGRFVGSGHAKANICECRDHSGCWTDSSEAVANARLISAAPELLDALRALLHSSGVDERASAQMQSHAAINKATGGAA